MVGILLIVFAIVSYSRRPSASGQSDAAAADLNNKYSAAMEKLAHRDLQSRIVGIRELEEVAEFQPYREKVTQVLVSFVRQRVPWNEEAKADPRLPEDVQAAMLVIGRWPQEPASGESWLNLRGTDLRGAELGNLHFEHGYFSGAHLERALIRFGHFERAVLASAHLENTSLNNAHFEEADLEGVHFEDAKLQGAHLEGATLGPRPNDEPHRQHLDAVGLTCDQVKSAHVNKSTVLPSYLRGSACSEGTP
jgi:Pentapeptide repeats (9 copies)